MTVQSDAHAKKLEAARIMGTDSDNDISSGPQRDYAAEDQLYETLQDKVVATLNKLKEAGVITHISQAPADVHNLAQSFNVFFPNSTRRDMVIEVSNTAINGPSIRIPSESFSAKVSEEKRNANGVETRQHFHVNAAGQKADTSLEGTTANIDTYMSKVEAFIRKAQPAMA